MSASPSDPLWQSMDEPPMNEEVLGLLSDGTVEVVTFYALGEVEGWVYEWGCETCEGDEVWPIRWAHRVSDEGADADDLDGDDDA